MIQTVIGIFLYIWIVKKLVILEERLFIKSNKEENKMICDEIICFP
jgi:transcription elongation factor GreA-like protein